VLGGRLRLQLECLARLSFASGSRLGLGTRLFRCRGSLVGIDARLRLRLETRFGFDALGCEPRGFRFFCFAGA
jgi:hypothetical protein